jgi:hypothetical protein
MRMKSWLILSVLLFSFSVSAQMPSDTAKNHQTGIQKVSDSLSATAGPSGLQQTQKIRIIKKEINFSTASKLAIGMMVFIAVLFFTTQAWNPGGVSQ